MPIEHSPFHDGELRLQHKYGVREQVHTYAVKGIRSFMPDQHRSFYEALPYAFLSVLRETGYPEAHLMTGDIGFIQSPDPLSLVINGCDLAGLSVGMDVGLLGLDLSNRRRNRVNGRIHAFTETGIKVAVTQSFGNCPKYIQKRAIVGVRTNTSDAMVSGPEDYRRLIEQADTFFWASATQSADHHGGADMSHRGGYPGFVKFVDQQTLLFPDFAGNNFFNSLGNIAANNKVALLFLDFKAGNALHVKGEARLLEVEESPFKYENAQRYVQVDIHHIDVRENAMPYLWSEPEASPFLTQTRWEKVHD